MRLSHIILLGLALAVIGTGSWLIHWNRRLQPIMRGPAAQVVPSWIKLNAPPDARRLDLGYARFSVPAAFLGELVQVNDSLFVELSTDSTKPTLVFVGPPLSDLDPEVQNLTASVSQLLGQSVKGMFDLHKRALLTEPFSVWSALLRGKQQTLADLTLSTVKITVVRQATSAQIFESADRAAIVVADSEFTTVELHDLRRGITQTLFIGRGTPDREALVAAVATSYEYMGATTDPEALKQTLRDRHIPSRSIQPAAATPLP